MSTLQAKKEDSLSVGDRVSRSWLSETRYGTVSDVYESLHNCAGHFHLFYAVTWDDTGLTERGYMRIGLKKVASRDALQVPTMRIA